MMSNVYIIADVIIMELFLIHWETINSQMLHQYGYWLAGVALPAAVLPHKYWDFSDAYRKCTTFSVICEKLISSHFVCIRLHVEPVLNLEASSCIRKLVHGHKLTRA